MKRIVCLLALLLVFAFGWSQTMTIHFKNGNIQKFNMSEIEAINFTQGDNSSQDQDVIEGDFVKVTFESRTYQESMPFYCQIDPVGKEGNTPLTFTYDAIEHFKKEGFEFMLGLMHYSRKGDLLRCSPGRYPCEGGIYNGYINLTFTASLEIDYYEYDFVSGSHQVTSIKEVGGRVQIEGNFTSSFEYRGNEKTVSGSYRMTIPD